LKKRGNQRGHSLKVTGWKGLRKTPWGWRRGFKKGVFCDRKGTPHSKRDQGEKPWLEKGGGAPGRGFGVEPRGIVKKKKKKKKLRAGPGKRLVGVPPGGGKKGDIGGGGLQVKVFIAKARHPQKKKPTYVREKKKKLRGRGLGEG